MTIYPKLVRTPNHLRVPHVSPLRRGIPQIILALSALAPTLHAQTTASPVHGAQLFTETGCAHCHGPAGSGGDRGPDLKNIARRMTPQKIATQIHDGGQSMPPFGEELKDQDIADLVAYLRAKRKPLPPPKPSEPIPPPS